MLRAPDTPKRHFHVTQPLRLFPICRSFHKVLPPVPPSSAAAWSPSPIYRWCQDVPITTTTISYSVRHSLVHIVSHQPTVELLH